MTESEYDQLKRDMTGWLLKRCPEDWVEDIVHDVMANYWEKRESVQDRRSYMFRSARNRMVDYFRLHRKATIFPIQLFEDDGREPETPGETRGENNIIRAAWRSVLTTPGMEETEIPRMMMEVAVTALRKTITPQQEELMEDLMDIPVNAYGRYGPARGSLKAIAKRNGENQNTVKARKHRLLQNARRVRHLLD